MTKKSQMRVVAMAVLIGVLAANPASSACLFCKGGALSIDKPFDKGGTLSIDKPFDKGGSLSIDKPFDKGGALSIDKPFDKGGTLSIDKPFDFTSKAIARAERSASEILNKVIVETTAMLQKLVVWIGVALAAVLAFALILAMGLAALILRRDRPRVEETNPIHQL